MRIFKINLFSLLIDGAIALVNNSYISFLKTKIYLVPVLE